MFFHHINPTTGLPMTSDDIGGIDVGGNPYGSDWNQHPWSSSVPCDGSFGGFD
jgi:hypothetical protein